MTVKQIAELAGVSRDSVERTVRDLYPALMEKGKTTVLDHAQSVAVMGSVRKANMVSLPQNAEVLPQNAEAATSMRALMLEMIPAMTAAMVAALRQVQPVAPSMLRQAQLALPAVSPEGDWYTVKGYGNRRATKVNGTVAVQLGREAARLSRERNIEIRKATDEQWGEVNCYHVSVLKDVFTV